MTKRVHCGLATIILAATTVSCGRADVPSTAQSQAASPPGKVQSGAKDRPAKWAVPIRNKPGLPNLHKVSDELYRGAQPEDKGFAQLKALGIKTVVNLRTFHSDRKQCEQAGLDYVHIRVQAWEGEDDEVVEFLKVATDPKRQPVFVHCQHGADRTGTMCAIYRLAEQGWSKDEAIREMTDGGYGFHSVWQNLIKYLRNLDVKAIKARM